MMHHQNNQPTDQLLFYAEHVKEPSSSSSNTKHATKTSTKSLFNITTIKHWLNKENSKFFLCKDNYLFSLRVHLYSFFFYCTSSFQHNNKKRRIKVIKKKKRTHIHTRTAHNQAGIFFSFCICTMFCILFSFVFHRYYKNKYMICFRYI